MLGEPPHATPRHAVLGASEADRWEHGGAHLIRTSPTTRPHSLTATREFAPTWKGIVEAADEQDSSLIVLGSHGRSGLADVLIGSVAEAVAAHSRRVVLNVHR
jgi:nucleotide-binding universal stress UspA family protein